MAAVKKALAVLGGLQLASSFGPPPCGADEYQISSALRAKAADPFLTWTQQRRNYPL